MITIEKDNLPQNHFIRLNDYVPFLFAAKKINWMPRVDFFLAGWKGTFFEGNLEARCCCLEVNFNTAKWPKLNIFKTRLASLIDDGRFFQGFGFSKFPF